MFNSSDCKKNKGRQRSTQKKKILLKKAKNSFLLKLSDYKRPAIKERGTMVPKFRETKKV